MISDLCTWWPLWWILPFLMGLLTGWYLRAGSKKRIKELEQKLSQERSQNYDIRKDLRKCDAETDQLKKRTSKLLKEIEELDKGKQIINPLSAGVSEKAISVDGGLQDKQAAISSESSKDNFALLLDTNLQVIEGIGPRLESLLQENGIIRWSDLANKSTGELRALLDKHGNRYEVVNPDAWPKQAQMASKRDFDRLINFQHANDGSSKLKKIMTKLGIL